MAASSPRQPNASPGRSAAPSRGKTSTPARSRTDRSVATPAPRRRRDLVAVALSVAGEVLVTLGVLLALMVAWQLWWTDIGAHHHQQEIVEALPWAVPPIVVPEASEPSSDGATTPVYLVVPGNEKRVSEAPPDEPRPSDAETFATLYVPRWGYDYVRPISEGVDRRTVLDRLGIGHYPETGLPGAWGNFAIAGHRTTFGKPFAEIESLKVGDALVVRTASRW